MDVDTQCTSGRCTITYSSYLIDLLEGIHNVTLYLQANKSYNNLSLFTQTCCIYLLTSVFYRTHKCDFQTILTNISFLTSRA